MKAPTTRRRFFGLMGGGAIAGKVAAEQAAKQLAGFGYGGSVPPSVGLSSSLGIGSMADKACAAQAIPVNGLGDYEILRKARDAALRAALGNRTMRGEIESILYERCRHVYTIEPDLAGLRSYSLMAKITYQRQRMVERELEEALFEKTTYTRIREWGERVLKAAGIKF